MAWAVLDRVRAANDGWAIEANLSRGPILSSDRLAAHLAEQARTAQVRIDSGAARAHDGAEAAIRYTAAFGKLAERLGLGAGITDVATTADAMDQALSADEESKTDLRSVLRAIQAAALAADSYVVVFIDEAQRLVTDWSDDEDSLRTQEALAEVMEDDLGGVVLLMAGSDQSGFEQLMAEGQPMHQDGMFFEVRAIEDDDWHHHLPLRFVELGLTIERDRVTQILKASNGHPQRTMRVCAQVRQLAEAGRYEISDVLVDQSIEAARKHPSWSD